ncbi:Unknown protein [Striga hermonthica]|uniref:Uncharacterized protein n=1 Tax=Striga hermonthica TaxID=68872 RepID=A0A9N7NL13_STRHE|nr:Unknown protein [Striga hermonthica]
MVVPPDRPDPTSESKVGSTLDLTRIAPSILLRIGLVSNPGSNMRKEEIQPHLPVRLPCYDFTPVTSPAFGIPPLAVKVRTSGMASFHSVTGGVYKAQERIHRRMADRRLLAIPTSCRRVAAYNRTEAGFLGLAHPRGIATLCPGHCSTRVAQDALRPIIPDNACILCLTAAAGTELADAYSPDTVIASSPGKEVHDPWAFYLHAALLRQDFAHCGKFPTAPYRRSLGRVSVPVWLIILSD